MPPGGPINQVLEVYPYYETRIRYLDLIERRHMSLRQQPGISSSGQVEQEDIHLHYGTGLCSMAFLLPGCVVAFQENFVWKCLFLGRQSHCGSASLIHKILSCVKHIETPCKSWSFNMQSTMFLQPTAMQSGNAVHACMLSASSTESHCIDRCFQ